MFMYLELYKTTLVKMFRKSWEEVLRCGQGLMGIELNEFEVHEIS